MALPLAADAATGEEGRKNSLAAIFYCSAMFLDKRGRFFFSAVSSRIFNLVLFLQIGQMIHSIMYFYFSARIIMVPQFS